MNHEGERIGEDRGHMDAEPLPDGDFAERLSAAIARRRLGLQRLSGRLREEGISCSPSTLSLWSNGRTMPRRAGATRAVAALEPILRVPGGYLQDAAREGRRPRSTDRGWASEGDADVPLVDRLFHRAREELGFLTDPSRTRRLLIHETFRVDENRCFAGLWVRQVLRAEGGTAERVLVGAFADIPAGSDPAEIGLRRVHVGIGGRLGRVREFPEAGVSVAEVLLERPLQDGELTVLEYTLVPGAGPEPSTPGWNIHEVSSLVPVQQLVTEVAFHPRALPAQVRGTIHHDSAGRRGGPRTEERDLELQGTLAIVSGRDLHGGRVAIRWRWERS